MPIEDWVYHKSYVCVSCVCICVKERGGLGLEAAYSDGEGGDNKKRRMNTTERTRSSRQRMVRTCAVIVCGSVSVFCGCAENK